MVLPEKEQTPSLLFSINICFREVLPETWSELCCYGYFPIPASSTSFSASCHQSTVSSSNLPLRTQNYTHQFLVIFQRWPWVNGNSGFFFLVLGKNLNQCEWWLYIVDSGGNAVNILGYWCFHSLDADRMELAGLLMSLVDRKGRMAHGTWCGDC